MSWLFQRWLRERGSSRSYVKRVEADVEDQTDYLRPPAPGTGGAAGLSGAYTIVGGGGFRNAITTERLYVLELHGRETGHVVGEYMSGMNVDVLAVLLEDLLGFDGDMWRRWLSSPFGNLQLQEGKIVWSPDKAPIHIVVRRVA